MSMGYSIAKYQKYSDGSELLVKNHHDMYVARLSKTKDNLIEIEYVWSYESESLQSVMAWVNQVRKTPLPYKYFESGVLMLPHNNGFGNKTGKRTSSTS